MDDVAPKLLEALQTAFQNKFDRSKLIERLYEKLEVEDVDYQDANALALEVGKILASVYQENLSSDVLPDGKMYYNIAKRIIEPTMKENYELVSTFSIKTQTAINHKAKIGIKGIKAPLNEDRIRGIVDRVSSEDDFDKVKWILDEPVINFTQSVVNDTIEENVKFNYKAGLKPKIVRRVVGECCEWCEELAGTYVYPNMSKDVYSRHNRCRCTVEYIAADGKRQDVWSKKQIDPEKEEKIEARKEFSKQANKIKSLEKLKNSGIPEDDYKEYLNIINNHSNKNIKTLYSKYADKISGVEFIESKGGAYQRSSNSLTFNFNKNKNYSDMNKFTTLAHEYGHFFDANAEFKGLNFKEISSVRELTGLNNTFPNIASSSDEFLAALRKDKELLNKNITKEVIEDFMKHNASSGIQDAISGLFPKSRINWGHDERYYNRKYNRIADADKITGTSFKKELQKTYKDLGLDASNQTKAKDICRQYDTASETWANMMDAEVNGGDALDYVKKYLPNSYAAMLKILKGVK